MLGTKMSLVVVLLEPGDTPLVYQPYCLWINTDKIFLCRLTRHNIQSQLFPLLKLSYSCLCLHNCSCNSSLEVREQEPTWSCIALHTHYSHLPQDSFTVFSLRMLRSDQNGPQALRLNFVHVCCRLWVLFYVLNQFLFILPPSWHQKIHLYYIQYFDTRKICN